MEKNNESMTTERIWKLLSTRLRSFFLQRASDEQVAEDLLQETFIRIHENLNDIDDVQRLTSWVFQIARNLVVDHYRSKSRTATTRADDLEASGTVRTTAKMVAARTAIVNCLTVCCCEDDVRDRRKKWLVAWMRRCSRPPLEMDVTKVREVSMSHRTNGMLLPAGGLYHLR